MANVELTTTEDVEIGAGDSDQNYNESYYVLYIGWSSEKWRSLMKFDLSSIPSGSTITSAVLRMSQNDTFVSADFTFERITGAWNASTVIWDTKPAVSATNSVTASCNSSSGWKNVATVTDLVKDAFALGSGCGICGRGKFETSSDGFHNFARGAKLNITYDLPTGDYYVKVGGNDSLGGNSWANAWATVHKAATTVPDGSTVHIGFGDYTAEPAANKIAPQNAGATGIIYHLETATTGGGTGTVSIEQNA